MSSPVAKGPETLGQREKGGGGVEGRITLCEESGFAQARHAHGARLTHDRPKMTDTHGGPDRLADCPPLPPSFGVPAERRNQHTSNTHTTPRTHPRLPHGAVTSGHLQPANDGHFRFPDNIWRSRGGTSGSPQVPKLHFRGARQESPRPQTVSS